MGVENDRTFPLIKFFIDTGKHPFKNDFIGLILVH